MVLCSFCTILASCIKNPPLINKPQDYDYQEVKSHAELFKIFWTVMNDRYAYFYEQKEQGGKSWQQVYDEYYPKFQALKYYTLEERKNLTDKDVQEEFAIARGYYIEIMDPIVDKHFNVQIELPYTKTTSSTNYYIGGMKQRLKEVEQGEVVSYEFSDRVPNMAPRLLRDGVSNYSSLFGRNFMAGRLITNPDIYYISYEQFSLYISFRMSLKTIFSPDNTNKDILSVAEIEANDKLKAIADPELRNSTKKFTVDVLNAWDNFFHDPEVKALNEQITIFNNTEVANEELYTLFKSLNAKTYALPSYEGYGEIIVDGNRDYVNWFKKRMTRHVEKAYSYLSFYPLYSRVNTCISFYQRVLNPLTRGDYKKVIIDLRSNSGGSVVDARFFTDRFITKSNLFAYQRTKEGNTPYSYSPWLAMNTQVHKFGIKNNIPMVILLDRFSASMSEISTLMWQSQGDHVTVIGENSSGATAGLGASNLYNAGYTEDVTPTSALTFYMPLLALKDAKGRVIEGVGITPDIRIPRFTKAEREKYLASPKDYNDEGLEAAIKVLAAK